jgi:hypothetical protein
LDFLLASVGIIPEAVHDLLRLADDVVGESELKQFALAVSRANDFLVQPSVKPHSPLPFSVPFGWWRKISQVSSELFLGHDIEPFVEGFSHPL